MRPLTETRVSAAAAGAATTAIANTALEEDNRAHVTNVVTSK